ncbi:head-tail connector protein [Carnobacteriaceae bacterium zg-ZUI252]|nr:head-tail connector protein [Carnobacteriaceae bacterium zg-ZUI252]
MPLITAEDVMISQRYDEADKPFIKELIDGATAFLKSAGAYHENNPLTKTALHLIVGNWLENRALDYRDYKNTENMSIGIRSVITQLQYSGDNDGEKS